MNPCSPGTTSTPATCRGGSRRPPRGRCWSASSCSSRPRSPGCSRCTSAGWTSGRGRPTWPPYPRATAVRAWGRLGYPRRALRLHAAATAIVERHGGVVPEEYADLIALPGVGDYTAAAVASFAYRRRHVVLDTNVRRVLARTVSGVEFPANAVTRAERDLASRLLPEDGPTAAAWAVATMELGATVCVAASPRCAACPVTDLCAWRGAGYPAYDGPPRRGQTYDGTDRQCRGRLLGVLRDSHEPVPHRRLVEAWPAERAARAVPAVAGRRRAGGPGLPGHLRAAVAPGGGAASGPPSAGRCTRGPGRVVAPRAFSDGGRHGGQRSRDRRARRGVRGRVPRGPRRVRAGRGGPGEGPRLAGPPGRRVPDPAHRQGHQLLLRLRPARGGHPPRREPAGRPARRPGRVRTRGRRGPARRHRRGPRPAGRHRARRRRARPGHLGPGGPAAAVPDPAGARRRTPAALRRDAGGRRCGHPRRHRLGGGPAGRRRLAPDRRDPARGRPGGPDPDRVRADPAGPQRARGLGAGRRRGARPARPARRRAGPDPGRGRAAAARGDRGPPRRGHPLAARGRAAHPGRARRARLVVPAPAGPRPVRGLRQAGPAAHRGPGYVDRPHAAGRGQGPDDAPGAQRGRPRHRDPAGAPRRRQAGRGDADRPGPERGARGGRRGRRRRPRDRRGPRRADRARPGPRDTRGARRPHRRPGRGPGAALRAVHGARGDQRLRPRVRPRRGAHRRRTGRGPRRAGQHPGAGPAWCGCGCRTPTGGPDEDRGRRRQPGDAADRDPRDAAGRAHGPHVPGGRRRRRRLRAGPRRGPGPGALGLEHARHERARPAAAAARVPATP